MASLSLTGIPLFAGFISKWNIARAAFACGMGSDGSLGGMAGSHGASGWRYLAFGAVAVLLYSALMTGIYMLTVVIRAYFPKVGAALAVAGIGPGLSQIDRRSGADAGRCDPNWMMLVPLLLFAAAIILMGIHSAPLMELFLQIGGEAG